jgi:ABC-type transport system involved in cytochrome c biogenesis permease component
MVALDYSANLSLLGAILLLGGLVVPFAASAAVKISLD